MDTSLENPRPQRQGPNHGTMWFLAAHLVCCGGAALLLLVGGTGMVGIGVARASVWPLMIGVAAVAAGVVWRRRRRVNATHDDTRLKPGRS